MSHSSLSNIYQQVEVNTSNSLKLVVMLYDGAIRFLCEARQAILIGDVRAKAIALDRALAIVGELQGTLKLEEGGDIAASLNNLYTYMNENILEGSAKMDTRPLDQVIKLLRTLNSGWSEIAQKSEQLNTLTPLENPGANHLPLEETRRPLEVFG